jgi:serine/threonine protein kinase
MSFFIFKNVICLTSLVYTARGDYIITKTDHIAYRYEIVSVLGKGSFGQVLQVLDHASPSTSTASSSSSPYTDSITSTSVKPRVVALKIIRNKKRFERQGAVEVNVLTILSKRPELGRSCTVRVFYTPKEKPIGIEF